MSNKQFFDKTMGDDGSVVTQVVFVKAETYLDNESIPLGVQVITVKTSTSPQSVPQEFRIRIISGSHPSVQLGSVRVSLEGLVQLLQQCNLSDLVVSDSQADLLTLPIAFDDVGLSLSRRREVRIIVAGVIFPGEVVPESFVCKVEGSSQSFHVVLSSPLWTMGKNAGKPHDGSLRMCLSRLRQRFGVAAQSVVVESRNRTLVPWAENSPVLVS